jgi:hypothetical protein
MKTTITTITCDLCGKLLVYPLQESSLDTANWKHVPGTWIDNHYIATPSIHNASEDGSGIQGEGLDICGGCLVRTLEAYVEKIKTGAAYKESAGKL